jgi:23S rRNA pseudouridine2605 synthase
VLAQAGVASRREAERLILQGRVWVNGQAAQLGESADLDSDTVALDGLPLVETETVEYYVLNKPAGVVTTVRDPQGRRTVREVLAPVKTRVFPVGRLDAESEGLLLLTNDGDLAYRLTHPRFGIEKEYVALLSRPVAEPELDRIRRGIKSDGQHLVPRRAALEDGSGTKVVVVLAEGRKREVRRMFEAIGHRVTALERVRFGPLCLGDLPRGQFRALTKDEIEQLKAAASG